MRARDVSAAAQEQPSQMDEVLHQSQSAVGFAGIGVALEFVIPLFSKACYAMAGSSIATIGLAMLIDAHNIEHLANLKEKVMDWQARYPHVRAITFVATLILAIYSINASIFAGVVFGIGNGFCLYIEGGRHALQAQDIS